MHNSIRRYNNVFPQNRPKINYGLHYIMYDANYNTSDKIIHQFLFTYFPLKEQTIFLNSNRPATIDKKQQEESYKQAIRNTSSIVKDRLGDAEIVEKSIHNFRNMRDNISKCIKNLSKFPSVNLWLIFIGHGSEKDNAVHFYDSAIPMRNFVKSLHRIYRKYARPGLKVDIVLDICYACYQDFSDFLLPGLTIGTTSTRTEPKTRRAFIYNESSQSAGNNALNITDTKFVDLDDFLLTRLQSDTKLNS